MLTIDDCNTIIKKYGNNGYWIDIDFKDLEFSDSPIAPNIYQFELIEVRLYSLESDMNVNIRCPLWNPLYFAGYITNHDGEILDVPDWIEFYSDSLDMIAHVLVLWPESVPSSSYDRDKYAFFPLTLPVIDVINGEFDNKFYVLEWGGMDFNEYTIDGEVVEVDSDAKGTYFTLPSATSCLIGAQYRQEVFPYAVSRYKPWRVSFREFKELPIPYIPTLYKGTPQSIQVFNSEDDTPISDYQCQYQGRILKDNTIQLPYDSDDYVDIVVDLKDYRYPFCRVKLKAPTTLYTANSQSDVETAIENGIQTLQVGDNQTEVTLNSIELSNVTLINSNIQVSESILNDCQIIDTSYTDNGDNSLTDCTIKTSTITSTGNPSKYNDCIITECTVTATELRLTGAITNTTLSNSLIISDGIIEVIGNTFTGKYSKDYFPSFLYLTGDYLSKNNTFTLNDEWTEPAFNMCIIKSIDSFNPSLFIAENTFNLNIEYSTEEPNTFYYNIVDDDKIKAKRLS